VSLAIHGLVLRAEHPTRRSQQPMSIVAEQFDHVVGIDTHARTHTYCVVHSRTGAVVDSATFPTSAAGCQRALAWIRRRASTTVLAAVEGTSSYGAGITAVLVEADIDVAEVRPGARSSHAHAGKSDVLDAEAAARAVLGRDYATLARPRHRGDRVALRVLPASRSLIDQQRTANRNALTALLRSVELGVDARKPLSNAQIKTIASWRTTHADTATVIARAEARRLAASVVDQTRQLLDNMNQLRAHAEQLAPGLQSTSGIGPMTASVIICAYSHRGRVRSEAAFAALAGVAPLPASSGNTTRHRLSRAGDRQLNRAFDTIVRTRMTFDPATRDYLQRRTAEGKTRREARRTLKRYVCRSVFRQLEVCMA
jgi:transposase